MNYNKKTVQDVDVRGKKVLLRCDFNVPQDKETGAITSDKRIVAALPTIHYLLDNGAAVIACSHLGKPKGEWKAKLTLAPVAQRLSQLLGQEVIFAKDVVGEDAKAKAAALKPGQIMLLENLRFDIREEKNDPGFARELADMAELYVSDAFGTVHRAHASTAGVAAYLPAVSGFLVAKELAVMGKAPGRSQAPLRGGAGRRQGHRQDRRYQQPAGQGRHRHHRRRHGLYLCQGAGRLHRQEPVRAGLSWTTRWR